MTLGNPEKVCQCVPVQKHEKDLSLQALLFLLTEYGRLLKSPYVFWVPFWRSYLHKAPTRYQ